MGQHVFSGLLVEILSYWIALPKLMTSMIIGFPSAIYCGWKIKSIYCKWIFGLLATYFLINTIGKASFDVSSSSFRIALGLYSHSSTRLADVSEYMIATLLGTILITIEFHLYALLVTVLVKRVYKWIKNAIINLIENKIDAVTD